MVKEYLKQKAECSYIYVSIDVFTAISVNRTRFIPELQGCGRSIVFFSKFCEIFAFFSTKYASFHQTLQAFSQMYSYQMGTYAFRNGTRYTMTQIAGLYLDRLLSWGFSKYGYPQCWGPTVTDTAAATKELKNTSHWFSSICFRIFVEVCTCQPKFLP